MAPKTSRSIVEQDQKINVSLRIHRKEQRRNDTIDTRALHSAIESALTYGWRVSVAVDGTDAALLHAVQGLCAEHGAVHVVQVAEWSNFVPALNALVTDAARAGADYILFQSVEVSAEPSMIETLKEHLDDDVFVVGGCLPGHNFREGTHRLNGSNSPWNTLALWDLSKLALTGFPMVADGLVEDLDGGIEEVSTIAIHQTLQPATRRALVVELPGLEWHTDFQDPKRAEWHRRKMSSKVRRAEKHLRALHTPDAYVQHVRCHHE